MAAALPASVGTLRQIDALLQAGDFRAAQEQLAALVAQQPQFVEGLRLLAGTHQALGDRASAEHLLRRALTLDPQWTPTLAMLGELLLGSGRGSEAESLLRAAAAGTPPSARAALILARHCNDTHRPRDALAVATRWCARAKADPELVAQHVAALAALGRAQEAVDLYSDFAAAAPDDPRAAHALAIALDAADRPTDAERAATHALARGGRSAALHFTHARALVALGEFERAETALRDGLRLEPRKAEAHASLARLVWMRCGDAAQATALLDEVLRGNGADDALLATKAAVLQGAGDARAAYACLAQGAAQPQAVPALLIRAGLAALEFDPAIARTLAARAQAAMPANLAALNLLAAAELGIGDAASALRHCEILRQATPDDQYPIALQTLAWRLLGDPRYAELCDYARLVVPYHLETPAGWPDLAAFFADLVRSLGRLHNPHGHALLFQSLRNGTETTGDLARSTDPVIQALFRSFDAPIRAYLRAIGSGHDPLRRRNNGTYRFNGGWSVRLRSSGFHNSHVHPRGWISSACYIELPDTDPEADAGALVFGKPSLITAPALEVEHTLHPQVGMLALFPSYVWHGTVPFVSTRTRLTVAFDVVPERS
ncbi:MAG: tetratricopeptide repeat protein [Proteobacteria bacterium]|nr:tetratricopeptide repeat protein [Pseudomonadota bacterium]